MSKNKKTIEELLEEAVVPKEEQTYEVPENWVYFKFTSIFDVQGGTQPPKSQFVDEEREGYVRLVQIRDFSSDKYKTYIPDTQKLRKMKEEDILIARYGASIGRILTGLSGAYNVALAKVVYPKGKIDKKFLFWLLKSEHFQIPLMGISRSAQSGFNKNDLSYFKMPLPPLNEQKRIAEKVECLLSKIDEANQLIEEAKETFELRRAAILDKAFRGELSKGLHVKEKNENNEDEIEFNHNNEEFYELPYNWRWVSLESVCETITDGDHQAPPKSEEGIPFLVISNINKGVLDFQETRFVPKEYYNKLHAKRKPKVGDVLYSVTGSYGIPVLVDTDKEFCFQRHIAILKPSEDIRSKYLYYILKSRLVYNQATNYATGTAQLTVPLSGLRKIKIPLPSLNEQNYIVGKIERMFNKQAYAEKFCIISNENIEVLKQSILSKAFKGELGTNNPSEENAIELLKQVLQEQVK
ncbi:restriction endonuclease subunit S [Bacillus amyloliquefaciens]|uniref:restriction endonuclease subunit S n=1 Tax=Bacillus amyloliquefaciens TaxID=1390 RepID=UPI00336BAE5E